MVGGGGRGGRKQGSWWKVLALRTDCGKVSEESQMSLLNIKVTETDFSDIGSTHSKNRFCDNLTQKAKIATDWLLAVIWNLYGPHKLLFNLVLFQPNHSPYDVLISQPKS